jgi:hypothetical protein
VTNVFDLNVCAIGIVDHELRSGGQFQTSVVGTAVSGCKHSLNWAAVGAVCDSVD